MPDLKKTLDEKQIYRIDHYLGKETVQNVMVFRFTNNIIEPLWNRHYVDHVQITAAETVGVEHRGGFYETAGALRDMVPNHLFQLLTMTAMEPPISFDADEVRNKQAEVLHAIQPLSPEDVLTVHGPRPVWRGRSRRRARRGLPQRAGRLSRLQHRNVRRSQATDRQLALGWGSRFICAPGSAWPNAPRKS